jgi:pimeloyl-ACP methyl ester carboxylesterase
VSDTTLSARQRFMAFRRGLPRTPRLTRQIVPLRGLQIAVFSSPPVEGSVPLVCINGGLLFPHENLWPALAPLARNRQVILYDQRGRGESQAPPGPRAARIEHDAGDVGALRQALGLTRWDVLGHSWGGGIAMLAAEQDQEGVRKLVLVDSVGVTSGWLDDLVPSALARLAAPERAILERIDVSALMEPDPQVHSAYSRAIYPAWFADRDLASLFAPPRSTSVTGAAIAAGIRRTGYDWRPLLRGLRVPTIVIHGEADLLPASVAMETAGTIEGARLLLIAGAGHMPFWEAPEHFFRAVDAFLTE